MEFVAIFSSFFRSNRLDLFSEPPPPLRGQVSWCGFFIWHPIHNTPALNILYVHIYNGILWKFIFYSFLVGSFTHGEGFWFLCWRGIDARLSWGAERQSRRMCYEAEDGLNRLDVEMGEIWAADASFYGDNFSSFLFFWFQPCVKGLFEIAGDMPFCHEWVCFWKP